MPPPAHGGYDVLMVYGEWCGHSKRALPAFTDLAGMKDVKTPSGKSVHFVLVNEKDEREKVAALGVRGFPTYMVVYPTGEVKPFNAGNRSKEFILAEAEKLA